MSKVLNRKLFKKKYVQGFQAGGIVSLKKGGEANYFEDVPAGRFLKSAGQSLVKEGKKAGAALYDLGAVPINLGMEFLTGSSPGYSGAKFFNVEGVDPNKAYFMGVGTDATPKSLSEEKQKQAMRADTEVSGIEKQIQKDPSIRSKLTKLTSDDVPKNQIASAAYTTTGNKKLDSIIKDYEEKNFNQKTAPQKPKDETPDDPTEVATKKQLRNIMDEIAAERKEGFGVNVPLMKLALGLMKGTTTQPGLAGVAQIFGQAGEGALDAFLEQEKQRKDADIDLMELATKLKISQDEVAARKYAVDKQAELYGLKNYDPKKQEEALANLQGLKSAFDAMEQIKQIIAKNPSGVGFGAQLQNDISKVAESVFGFVPSQTSGVRQVDQLIDYLQLTLGPELLKGFKPISKTEMQLFTKTLGDLKKFGSPQDLYNRINMMQRLTGQALQRAAGSYDYNFVSPLNQGSSEFYTDKFGLGIKGTLEKKLKEEEAAKNKK